MTRYYYVAFAILLAAGLVIAGCGGGGGGGGGGGISVSLSPSSATIRPSSSIGLTATVAGTTNTAVSWTYSGGSVMVVPGTNTGTFVAPAALGTYTVKAISQADPTRSATAQINVSNEVSNVTVSIAPDDPELSPGQYVDLTATVTGTTNTAVTWSGSISGSGNTVRFTAPSAEGTYTVTATSVADTTKSDSTLILVTQESPPPPPPL